MNRFDKVALAAAVIVTVLFAGMIRNAFDAYVVTFHMPSAMIPVAILGWVVFTYGPITAAALFARWSKRVRRPWVLNLLAFPCIYVLAMIGTDMMLYAATARDFDDTLGAPVFAGGILFVIAVIGCLATLTSKWFAKPTDRAEPV
jgi:hypothetical protein